MTAHNLPAPLQNAPTDSVNFTEQANSNELHHNNRFVALFFNNSMFKVLRTTEGESVLQAKEVAEFLGYSDPDQAIHQHCKNIKKVVTKDGTQRRHVLAITEPDLFRLIIRSKKPEAQAFECWVMEEVLPCIYRTGKYKISRKLNPNAEGQAILEAAKAEAAAKAAQLDFFPAKLKVEFEKPVAARLGEERARLAKEGMEFPTEKDFLGYIVNKYFEEVV